MTGAAGREPVASTALLKRSSRPSLATVFGLVKRVLTKVTVYPCLGNQLNGVTGAAHGPDAADSFHDLGEIDLRGCIEPEGEINCPPGLVDCAGAADQCLAWRTAEVDAGPASEQLLSHGDAVAAHRGRQSGNQPGWTSAEDHKIVVATRRVLPIGGWPWLIVRWLCASAGNNFTIIVVSSVNSFTPALDPLQRLSQRPECGAKEDDILEQELPRRDRERWKSAEAWLPAGVDTRKLSVVRNITTAAPLPTAATAADSGRRAIVRAMASSTTPKTLENAWTLKT